MKGHEQLRLTADMWLRFALQKSAKPNSHVRKYTPRKTEVFKYAS